MTITHF